ncbi:MAG: hypothetical protein COV67_13705 [Nitrospinae bacterium CG11_big_fil_rev_8_21_14_0_20_56_8]|nr:MAG: hypothetical protein COV67_13705 [Nitrospinae bacterium CG11_big_fil_rev_8_21_14_0_20_56_8]
MPSLTHVFSPEVEELKEQRRILVRLEQELTEKELDLSTLHGELHVFERRYSRVVGVKYAELDEVKAQILDLAARFYPKSDRFRTQAESAREHARQSSGEQTASEKESGPRKKFKPSEDLKKLFRDVAKKIHPDLASNEGDREKRHRLMACLNQAYDRLDDEGIRAILVEWEAGDHSEAIGPGARLVKTLRQMAQVRKRIQEIHRELEKLKNSAMYRLKEKVERVERNGLDPLKEMAAEVDEKVHSFKARVRDLAAELE